MKSLSATWTDSKVLNVEYINLSDPKDDEVQIKVGSAGICGSDLHYIRGDKPVTVGSIPGHEIGGFVSAVGKKERFIMLAFNFGDNIVRIYGIAHPSIVHIDRAPGSPLPFPSFCIGFR